MKRKNQSGFTLVELLAVIVIIGILFGITAYIIKGTMATSLTQMEEINDTEIFEAAKTYVLETNKAFNSDGYACVSLQELVDYGYLNTTNEMNKIVKIIKNKQTKVIETVEYVNECN